METESGSETARLIQRLIETPEDFDFFRAVSLLEAHHRLNGGGGSVPAVGYATHPSEEFLRFCQRPSLRFQSRTIEAVTAAAGTQPMRMYVNFTGFFGPNGLLPLWVTEHAINCQRRARRQLAGGAQFGEGDIVDAALFAKLLEQSGLAVFEWLRERIAEFEKRRPHIGPATHGLLKRIEALGAHAFRNDANRGTLIDILDRLLAETDFSETGLNRKALIPLTAAETGELVGETDAERNWFRNRAHLRLAVNRSIRSELILGPDPRTGCDSSFVEFLNILQHRFFSLFFRAWSAHQLPGSSGNAKESLRTKHPGVRLLASLAGVGTSAVWASSPRDVDSPFFRYLGLLPARPRSAESLRTLLSDLLQVPVRIRQFVGRWIKLGPNECCQLGEDSPASKLGESLILGDEMFVSDLAFRVELGPLSFEVYNSLLPGTVGYQRLKNWVDFVCNKELSWELNLILHKEEIPSCFLAESESGAAQGVRLGWTSWLPDEERADCAHARDFVHDPELEEIST